MATTPPLTEFVDRGGTSGRVPAQIVLSWGERDINICPASAERALMDISLEEMSDLSQRIRDQGPPATLETRTDSHIIHVYGTDFDVIIEDLRAVIDREATDVEGVLIDGFRSIAPDAATVRDRLETLRETLIEVDDEIKIGIIDADPNGSSIWTVYPGSDEFDALLRTLSFVDNAAIDRGRDATKRDIDRWADIEYRGGRPGLGFRTEDGELVPAEDYTDVCATLELVAEDKMSKRKAALHLGTSPRTITRAIEDRPARYGLT